MEAVVKEILVTEDEIKEKVKELGKQITEDYKGKNLMLVGILKGAVIFMAELAKKYRYASFNGFYGCIKLWKIINIYGSSTNNKGFRL